MQKPGLTIDEYLAGLPEDRRQAMATVRDVIRQHLPEGYEEGRLYGMIGYYIPLNRYPKTYNGQPLGYVTLGSQKNYMSLYLMGCYGNQEFDAWFREEYRKRGKRLDMGKSCVRFKRLEDLPLDLIGQVVASISVDQFIQTYEQSRSR